MPSPVDQLYEDAVLVLGAVRARNDPSFQSAALNANATLSKSLIIAAASYFEQQITARLTSVLSRYLGDGALFSYVKGKAVDGQYFKLFDWNRRDASAFLAIFGPDFRDAVRSRIANAGLDSPERSFLQVGRLRNNVAHNFAAAPLELTLSEAHALCRSAEVFVAAVLEEIDRLGAEPV